METYVSKSDIEIVLNIPVTVLRNIIIPVWWGSTNHHSPEHWRGIRICLDDGLVLMPVANCVQKIIDDTNLYYSRWTGINMWDILHHHWHMQCQPLTQCLLIWKKCFNALIFHRQFCTFNESTLQWIDTTELLKTLVKLMGCCHQWPLLLTWLNFNPSMDK